MKQHERKMLVRTSLLGVALALAAAALSWYAQLDPVEHLLSDYRARWFQFFAPRPTDKIIHLDIDDGARDAIGRLPWDRQVYARLIDELTRLDAKAIALDVTFGDHQAARPGADPDAMLADAVKRSGRVILPVDFNLVRPESTIQIRMTELLIADLELPQAEAINRLRSEGMDLLGADYQTLFIEARRTACNALINRELAKAKGPTNLATLRAALLPRLQEMVEDSPMLDLLREQYDKTVAMRSLARFGRTIPAGPAQAVEGLGERPPIPALADAAGGTAFVDFVRDSDDVVRFLPTWLEHGGKLYPQLGLMLACAQMGIKPEAIQIEPDAMIIPRPAELGGSLRVPLRSIESNRHGQVGYIMDAPWFGNHKEDFTQMYGRENTHMSVSAVWDLANNRRRIHHNNELLDDAIKAMYEKLDPDVKLKDYLAHPPAPDDANARAAIAGKVLEEAGAMGYVEDYAHKDPVKLAGDDLKLYRAIHALEVIPAENGTLQTRVSQRTDALRSRIAGRSVLIGLTASGALDIVRTPIYTSCPGVVVHGVVFNAIMTGHVLRSAPHWAGPAAALALGLVATGIVAFFSPLPAFLLAAGVAILYALVNGLVLFDYGSFMLPAGAPLVAVGGVWAIGTLYRYVAERAERTRITRRFQNYVDPVLVDYVIENPAMARLDGQMRTMSVAFSDLAGFTTLSERLREKTVAILNEYLSLMVPLVTVRRGYVNKFLGDGIMFFFGAPRENSNHAADAIDTALAMQIAMKTFNESLTVRNLPTVAVRIGVSTGPMVVGDAGSRDPTDPGHDRSDYTVLGDSVNLGSRLEGANKATGSRILVTEETVKLCGDRFLFRPIARLQVVGKSEGVMTYEPLAPAATATDHEKKVAELTRAMVEPFLVRDFPACLAAADVYAQELGVDKLCELYRKAGKQYLEKPPEPGFDGRITLSEK